MAAQVARWNSRLINPYRTVFTLRPMTRQERGCCCPFAPGCAGSPCRSSGTFWEIHALVRERYEWATAPASAVISEERRAEYLQRIIVSLGIARAAVRGRRSEATR